MDLLLDTHAFIWFSEDSPSLPEISKQLIKNSNNNSFISMASLWEMSIKISLNKLKCSIPFEDLYDLIIENGFEILPISFNHLVKQNQLEYYHRDPFDRLIISQALFEDMLLISKETIFDQYDVKRIWDQNIF